MVQKGSTTKSITYRRATWLGPSAEARSIESLVRDVCERRTRARDRLVSRANGGALFLNRWEPLPNECQMSGIRAELVAYTDGQPAEIAHTRLLAEDTVNVEAQPPEEGRDFVEGRAFFIAHQDHVVVSTGGILREPSVAYFLREFLKRTFGAVQLIDLRKVMKVDQLQAIATHGVKSIEINAQLYHESLENGILRPRTSFISHAKEFFRNQIAEDVPSESIPDLADLQVGILLDLKGRTTNVKRAALGGFARHLAEDGEIDYKMILGNGMEITPREVIYSKPVSVPKVNGHLDHVVLWEKMYAYLDQLDGIGALDV